MAQFNKFIYGFVPGLLLPILFMWVYLNRFYPSDMSFLDALKQMFPSLLFGKLLLLSIMPNLLIVFIFYKSDSFKIATGTLLGGMPYFIGSIFML